MLAALNHPNIAQIYGIEESGGARFLVLELVEGETLAERLRRGPIPIEEMLAIAKEIAEGVEAAHEKGITHRDLKPANIKITKMAGVMKSFKRAILCTGASGCHRVRGKDGVHLNHQTEPSFTE